MVCEGPGLSGRVGGSGRAGRVSVCLLGSGWTEGLGGSMRVREGWEGLGGSRRVREGLSESGIDVGSEG